MKYYLLHFLLCFTTVAGLSQQRSYTIDKRASYAPDIVIVKLKHAADVQTKGKAATSRSKSVLSAPGINSATPAIPYITKKDKSARTIKGQTFHPLENIYRLTLDSDADIEQVINELLKSDEVIYAEPYYDHRPLTIPNDPEANPATGKQTYLDVIRAYDAWTIEQGDTSVVVAILDTGVDLDHADLYGNLSYNYDDPINGTDDDGDGLVDNFQGWDMANFDNIPEADTDDHGIFVAGLSSASTNNGLGIAGTGYNTRHMPIKIFLSGSNGFYRGYEAIALAADMGCKVINLSWGSPGSYSNFAQDIINYAVIDKDAAIVAAAGNTKGLLDFYPASYDNVLSVGATNLDDTKPNWSTYSYNIDIVAPGQSIFSTAAANSYGFDSGTSLSAPLVSGALALLRSRFPELNAVQAMELLRITTDDIYAIGNNSDYIGLMGTGRLNMFKALTETLTPAVRAKNINYNNGSGAYAFYGDSLEVSMDFVNYLYKTSSSASVTISCSSPYVTLLDKSFRLGSLAALDTIKNMTSPFKMLLSHDLPPNHKLTFRLDFKDGAYEDFQYFQIVISGDYINLISGNIGITVAGNGNLGYSQDMRKNGIGVTYKGTNVLDNIGLIITNGKSNVADNAPFHIPLNMRAHDFGTSERIKFYNNSLADFDLRSTFYDSLTSLGVRIEQKTLAWKDVDAENFKIMEYRVINNSSAVLNSIHTAIFADWNLNNKDENMAVWDASHNLGYVKDMGSDTLYTGLALLSNQAPIYYAANNKNYNGNVADISFTLNDEKKYDLVSQGVASEEAGQYNGGNDVSHFIGGTISELQPYTSEKVVFAMVTGTSLLEVQQAVEEARQRYQQYYQKPPLLYTAFTCPGMNATINPPQGEIYEFYSDPALTSYITTGTEILAPDVNSPQYFYVINKDSPYDSDVFSVLAYPKSVLTDFSINPDPLLLDGSGNTVATFYDMSLDAVAWKWDFDNGFTASVQNPIMNYTKTGTYTIKLTATNDLGCKDSTTKPLLVANRSNKPNIQSQEICKGEAVTLSATNATNLKVYADATLQEEIYSGSTIHTNPIVKDTIFYITSVDSVYESKAQKVSIRISDVMADFSYSVDTLDIYSKTTLQFQNKSQAYTLYYWLVDGQLGKVNEMLSLSEIKNSPFEVKLIAEDPNGCVDVASTIINPLKSATPENISTSLCPGDETLITPSPKGIFYFYSDSQLTNLIHKGTSIALSNIDSDSILYFTNVDNLIESEPASITLHVEDIDAGFTITYNESGANIENTSTGAQSFTWYLDGDTLSQAAQIMLDTLIPGTYELKLVVSNTYGCLDSHTDVLQVNSITSTMGALQPITFYPNPVKKKLYISSRIEAKIEVINMRGETLIEIQDTDDVVSFESIPDGIYLFKITTSTKTYYQKLIKKGE